MLRALGRDTQLAQSSLRFSLGRFTTAAEVDRAIASVTAEVARLRALSPAGAGRGRRLGRWPGHPPGQR